MTGTTRISIVLASCFALLWAPSKAQDIIYETSGINRLVKVLSADDIQVSFRAFESEDTLLQSISTAKIRRIRYQDGTMVEYGNSLKLGLPKESSLKQVPDFANSSPLFTSNFKLGIQDAQKHYTKYKATGNGVLITSIISPIVGLIPAIATSSTPPSQYNLGIPDTYLWQDVDYRSGYYMEANRKKKSAAWNSWLIGFGVNVLAVLVLLSAE